MKRVINPFPTLCVSTHDVSISKYYGVKHHGGPKGFITSTGYRKSFYTFSEDKLTIGNGWGREYSNLKELIGYLLGVNLPFEVYEFDTAKEMFKWLAD
jgi:hypothetical protein